MTTLVTARIQEMAEVLRRRLVELAPDVIVAINNASYHAFRLVASEPSSGLRPFLARLRHLNAVSYLPDQPSVVLFVSELEYGRSLREAAICLPDSLRASAHALALLENHSPEVRRARSQIAVADPQRVGESAASAQAGDLLNRRLHTCLQLDSEAFHEALGALRETTISRLNRPFNVDATLAYCDPPPASELSDFVSRLCRLGPLARLPHPTLGRWSLLRPRCLDTQTLAALLPTGVALQSLFFKFRVFELPQGDKLLLAPMCFARIALGITQRPLRPSAFQASSPDLAALLAIQDRHLRPDLSAATGTLAQYDMISYWFDLLLLRAVARHLEVPFRLERTSLNDYYGPLVTTELLSTVPSLLELALPSLEDRNALSEQDDLPDPLTPATLALIKTATLAAYESVNVGVRNRADWTRAGLTFEELSEATRLTPDTLSIGVDLLADAGLTESYNRIRMDPTNILIIDRAFNSLSDEFQAIIALIIARLQALQQQRPDIAISTSITTLNKFLALFFYLRGNIHVDIAYNKQGKTVWLRLDPEKGRDYEVTLQELLKLGESYFHVTSPVKQVSLTPHGSAQDWVTHMPSAAEQFASVEYATQLWCEASEEHASARSSGELKSGRSVFDIYSALVDCMGDGAPEWGVATIANLLEWAIDSATRDGKQDDVRVCLNSAAHKLRVLRDGGPVLSRLFARRVAGRLTNPMDSHMAQRLAVLPTPSIVLEAVAALFRATSQVIADGHAGELGNEVRLWSWIFHSPTARTREADSRLLLPSEMSDGYVVFIDLVPMKKLADTYRMRWPLASVAQLAPRWARLCRAEGGRSLSDSLAVGFKDAASAVRFACGASTHLDELHCELGKALGLEIFIQAAVAKGRLEVFRVDTAAGAEITGEALARAAGARSRKGYLRIEQSVWNDVPDEISQGLGPESGRTQAGFDEFQTERLFRSFVLSRIARIPRRSLV